MAGDRKSHRDEGRQVWRIRDATKVTELPVDYGTGVVFSPDGKWLMTTTAPCRLWTVGTWREARQIGGEGRCFSPDGRLVVVVDATRVIRLVETETGRTVARLESPDLCEVVAASFSPDGSRLVVTTNDGPAVHVWDLRAIRRQLARMGLDWDAPAYSDDDPADRSAPPLPPLHVDLGPLPLTASVDPRAYEPVIADLEAALRANRTSPASEEGWLDAATITRGIWPTRPDRAATPSATDPGPPRRRAGTEPATISTRWASPSIARADTPRPSRPWTGAWPSATAAYDGYDLFFQAMAHWQLGDKPQALACFHKALEWMEKNQQADEELVRFRAEAATLLGLETKSD